MPPVIMYGTIQLNDIEKIIGLLNFRPYISDLQRFFSQSGATKGTKDKVPRGGQLNQSFKDYLEQLDEIHIEETRLRIGHVVCLAAVLKHCQLTVLDIFSSLIGPDGMYVLQRYAP